MTAAAETHQAAEPGSSDSSLDEAGAIDYLQVVFENLRMLVLVPLLAGLVALGLTLLIPPSFTANTRFMLPQQQQSTAASLLQSFGALGGLAGVAGGFKSPAEQYVAFLASRSVQDALIDRFDLLERYELADMTDGRKTLGLISRVILGKDGLITVEVDDKDPVFAAELANAFPEELGRLLSRLSITEPQQRRSFFEKQLSETKDRLVKAEQALKASGVGSSALKASPQAAVEVLAKLQAAVRGQEVRLAAMRGYLAESAPEFKQALAELSALRSQLSRIEKEDPRTDEASGDYIAKFRDFKYQETLFEMFAKQYEIARLDESREGPSVQVLDIAVPPERKSKPRTATIAVITTLVVGFVLLLFVFFRDAVRRMAQEPASATKLNRLRQSMRKSIGLRGDGTHG